MKTRLYRERISHYKYRSNSFKSNLIRLIKIAEIKREDIRI